MEYILGSRFYIVLSFTPLKIALKVATGSEYTAGIGTHVYMAPEVCPRERESLLPYNKTSDIYALALIVHELFGGHGGVDFFPGPSDPQRRMISIIQAKINRDSPELELHKLPPTIQEVVRKGVKDDAEQRPSLQEFKKAVTEAAHSGSEVGHLGDAESAGREVGGGGVGGYSIQNSDMFSNLKPSKYHLQPRPVP